MFERLERRPEQLVRLLDSGREGNPLAIRRNRRRLQVVGLRKRIKRGDGSG